MVNTPPGPPRIIGDADSTKADIAGLAQYLSDFYASTVVEGYFAASEFVDANIDALANGDPVDLEDLPDPTNSSVSAAQTVANAAYMLAVQNAENIKAGSVTVTDPATTGAATFATEEPDTSYFVTLTASAESGTPAIDSHIVTSIAKTTTGFTVTVAAAPGASASVTFDWIKFRN